LQKPDGSLTSNLHETVKVVKDYLIHKDEQLDDTDYHKRIRAQSKEPILTADDRDYTPAQAKNVIYDLNHRKAPGEDSITSDIPESLRTIPDIYLHIKRVFKESLLSEVEKVKIIPITKPGKENSMEVSKFGPINPTNVGGKVLEKMLINRIMHRAYSNNFLNHNQFGFTPKKSAIDAALAVKEYLEEGMREGHVAILVSLDVKGAFDATW